MENDKGAIIDVGTLGAKLVASPIGTLALDLATGMLLRELFVLRWCAWWTGGSARRWTEAMTP